MLIVTWNVNSVNARLHNILDYLGRKSPDVVLLQEIKTQENNFPLDEFNNLKYNVEIFGQKSYNGVAILSKIKPSYIKKGLPNFNDDTQARYIECQIKGTIISCIYVPNGNPINSEKFEYKIKWLKKLKEYLLVLLNSNDNFLIGGDWNIAPKNDDVYDIEKFSDDAICHFQSKSVYREIENLGLVDIFRVFNSSKDEYTYFDYQRNSWLHRLGVRIDHFLASPYVAEKITSSGIDIDERGKAKPSDHVPLWCKLES